jgi:hypothetical protein
MAKSINCAKYLVFLDNALQEETGDSLLRLPTFLMLADMISIIKYSKLLFDDQISVKVGRDVAEGIQSGTKNETDDFGLTDDERYALTLSYEIFGKASLSDIAKIVHDNFGLWKEARQNIEGVDSVGATAIISKVKKFDMLRRVIQLVEQNKNNNDTKETINGKDFYYNPEDIEMTEELRTFLEEFSASHEAQEPSYFVDYDDGELLIY